MKKKNSALFFLLVTAFVILSLGVLSASAADGPVGTRPTQSYIIDFNKGTETYTNQTNIPQVGSSSLHIWLFPGDTLTFIPEGPIVKEDGKTRSYYVGAQCRTEDSGTNELMSFDTTTYGTPNSNSSNVFITKITVTGKKPVFLYFNSGGGCSSSEGIAYYAKGFVYHTADEYIPITYYYYNYVDYLSEDEIFYFGDTVNPERAYMSDSMSLSDGTCLGANQMLPLARPYAEGNRFDGWIIVNYKNPANEAVCTPELKTIDGMQYLSWKLSSSSRSDISYGSGAQFILRAEFAKNPTLTLDTDGGSLNGQEKTIIEAQYGSFDHVNLADQKPVREGYIFLGWYTDKTYSTKAEDVTDLLENYTYPNISRLYAKWGIVSSGWKKNDAGKWVYYENGALKTGWLSDSGKWYYLDANGIMKTGWVKSGTKWYYMNSKGEMQTGWVKSGTKWYYMNSSGAMLTGWQKISSKWYYLGTDGAMATGWLKIDGVWYYFESGGAMVTGWKQVSGKWYYFASSGAMQTGWLKISGKWYFFESSGAMKTGWYKENGKWYYFKSSGAMACNEKVTVSGKNYSFNSSGICLNP